MAEIRARAGGRVKVTFGEKIISADLNDIGTMAEQNMTTLASLLFRDDPNSEERSGFIGSGGLVTVSAGLTMAIAPGIGFYDDEAETDVYEPIYKIIAVPVGVTQALTAHDATNPRIDVLSLAPGTTSEDAQSRNIIDPTDGSVASSSIDKKIRRTYTLTRTTGTPGATPAAPATPAGNLKIAECLVPATAGAVTVTDCRAVLQISDDFKNPPPTAYHQNWVMGTSTELRVTQSTAPSMVLNVAAGEVDVRGTRVVLRQATTVTVTTADATNPRIDLVLARDTGVFDVLAGTPAGSPVAPNVPANAAVLAQVAVAATDTTLVDADITDRRLRQPYPATLLNGYIVPGLTVGAEIANQITVTMQANNPDGTAYRGTVRVIFEMLGRYGGVGPTGYHVNTVTGTEVSPTTPGASSATPQGFVMDTTAAGACSVIVTDDTTGVNRGIWLRCMVVNMPGGVTIADLGFN